MLKEMAEVFTLGMIVFFMGIMVGIAMAGWWKDGKERDDHEPK